VHVSDRMRRYMQDGGDASEIKQALVGLYHNQVLFETSSSEMTIVKRTSTVEMIKPIITNLFVIIVFFMVFLSIILNQSLIQTVSIETANIVGHR
jgi:hypothetical protein